MSLSGKKQSGLPVRENFGGASMRHLGLPLKCTQNRTEAFCLPFSRNPEARLCDSANKCASGIRWRSLLHPQRHGRIPDHVVVTSGHDAGRRQTRYALTCHSAIKLSFGAIGFCNLAECHSLKNGGRVNALRGAQALRKGEPLISPRGPASESVYSIAFKATVVGHGYVLLENFRVLTQADLQSLLQFNAGDDWLSLAKMLRQRV